MRKSEYTEGIMHCLTNRLRNDIHSISINDHKNTRLAVARNAAAYDWMFERDKNYCETMAGLIVSILDTNEKTITNKQVTEISLPGRELALIDMVLQCGPNEALAITFLSDNNGKNVEYAKASAIWQDPEVFVRNWTGHDCTESLLKTSSEVDEVLSQYEGQAWEAVPNKETVLLLPLIQSLETELMTHCSEDSKSASMFVKQLLPKYNDYYQFLVTDKGIISIYYDIQEKHGGMKLPTKMLSCYRKLRAGKLSNSILEIAFDNGWNLEIHFKIAQKKVSRRGLRYEITLKRLPATIKPKEYVK